MTASAQTAEAAAIAEALPPVEQYAPNVIVALLRVMRDLPAIGKDQTASAQQGGYAYRGIEQITQHTQRLFARHGVLFGMPRVVRWEIRDLTVNNKPWTDVIQEVEYDVYGPGGVDDKITVGPILCIGRDNSDKGGNKGLTQAYKYALLQALSISDSKDDGDGQAHEADAPAGMSKEQAKEVVRVLAEGDPDRAKAAWTAIALKTAWTEEALTAAYDAWTNEPPADPEGET